MSSSNKIVSQAHYNALIKKSKVGWAHFYQEAEKHHHLEIEYLKQIQSLTDHQGIPEFVLNELQELIIKLKKEIDCPICYEPITDKINFSSCGHKYCSTCLSKITECAVCRKTIYKKKF